MYGKFKEFLSNELAGITAAGLYKNERIITTPQRADIKVGAGSDVLNFCANNYLGLSDNSRLIEAAKRAMDITDMVCHRFVSSAELKTCINNWKLLSLITSILKILFYMLLASTLTVVCSNLCLQKKTLSSLTH